MNNYSNMPPFTSTIKTLNEQSYLEDILKLNKGKKVEIFQSFTDSVEWKDKIFNGIIEESGKDYVILSDPTNGNWYLLLLTNIDFIKFDEQINTRETFYPAA